MRFYLVEWRDESSPESVGFDFRKRKRDAEKLAAQRRREVRSEHDERVAEIDADPGSEYYELELASLRRVRDMNLEAVKVEVIDIPDGLSRKAAVFWALRYQVIQ